jgi:hypothetical protein
MMALPTNAADAGSWRKGAADVILNHTVTGFYKTPPIFSILHQSLYNLSVNLQFTIDES